MKLRKIVLGYNSSFGGFKFDLDLTFKLKPLIIQYSNGRPTLVRKKLLYKLHKLFTEKLHLKFKINFRYSVLPGRV